MDAKKLMTIEELNSFFSATQEFATKQDGDYVIISYTDGDKTSSSSIWAKHINIQQLIRTITRLVWNHCNDNILD
jgi:hypothetical protein